MSDFVEEMLAKYGLCDKDVMIFIDKFYHRGDNSPEDMNTLRKQFRAGYCWHFAHMLKSTFSDRGTVCLAYPYGHFVWVDRNGCPYDVEGVYDGEATYLLPENHIVTILDDFKHVTESNLSIVGCADVARAAIRGVCSKPTFDARSWWCNLSADNRRLVDNYYHTLYVDCINGNFHLCKSGALHFTEVNMPEYFDWCM